MAKTRAELIAEIKASMNGEVPAAVATAPKATAPVAKASRPPKQPAAKFQPVAVEDVEEEDEEEDEEEVGYSIESEDSEDDEPEVTPVEELVTRIESLIDYVVENGEAIRSWLAACRQ
jgi:hypothetical protein